MTGNPWDVLELSDLDDNAEKTYVSVGRALSAWESLEHQLACFFGFFATGNDDDLAARRAYGSVITFRGRIGMIQAAAEVYFNRAPDKELSARFDDVIKYATKFSPRRNEIAHGIVRSLMMRNPTTKDEKFGWALLPSEYATNKNVFQAGNNSADPEMTPKYLYSSAEIHLFTGHFEKLAAQAIQLMLDWGEKYPHSSPVPRL